MNCCFYTHPFFKIQVFCLVVLWPRRKGPSGAVDRKAPHLFRRVFSRFVCSSVCPVFSFGPLAYTKILSVDVASAWPPLLGVTRRIHPCALLKRPGAPPGRLTAEIIASAVVDCVCLDCCGVKERQKEGCPKRVTKNLSTWQTRNDGAELPDADLAVTRVYGSRPRDQRARGVQNKKLPYTRVQDLHYFHSGLDYLITLLLLVQRL